MVAEDTEAKMMEENRIEIRDILARHGNNQLVSYGYVGLHSNITNQIIIASADYVT